MGVQWWQSTEKNNKTIIAMTLVVFAATISAQPARALNSDQILH